MDLPLYFRVLWRFKLLVVVGTLLASMLALLTFARVSFGDGPPHLQYRQAEQWESFATLTVTEPGFPEGYRLLPSSFGQPERYAQLASLYSIYMGSDGVQEAMRRMGVRNAAVSAAPLSSRERGSLPLISVNSIATTPQQAIEAAAAGALALQEYVAERQIVNDVRTRDRVVLQVIRQAQGATLVQPRKMTTSIAIFLTVMMATFALAFMLENLRPRVRVLAGEGAADRPYATAARE